MRFIKGDYQNLVSQELEKDKELKEEYINAQIEYELKKIGRDLAEYRKKNNIPQGSIAEKTYLTQQMISRIENMSPKPSLETFLKYVTGMGLKIKFEPEDNNEEIMTINYSQGAVV